MTTFDWTDPTVLRVIDRVNAVKRKVLPQDCEQSRTLKDIALYYASNYAGEYDVMIRYRKIASSTKHLSNAQSADVINCMMTAYRILEAHRNPKWPWTEMLPDLPNILNDWTKEKE